VTNRQRAVWPSLVVLAVACAGSPGLAQAPAATPAPPAAAAPAAAPVAAPGDVATMNAILAALYDVISGPAGAPRNWERFASLFAPGARLMPLAGQPGAPVTARVLSPADYVERASRNFAQAGFYEKEVARRVDTYGGLTHVWSTYESRHAAADADPFARGINSIQLVNDGTRWWILTIAWQAERPDLPLPDKYRQTP
jgi:hypothetical protein